MIEIQRIYNHNKAYGFKILVDRLWPRGISKEELKVDLWMKEIAPSSDLRKWFGHDPEKWDKFKERYFEELFEKQELVNQVTDRAREGNVILLYGAKDELHNNAIALKEYIESGMHKRTRKIQ